MYPLWCMHTSSCAAKCYEKTSIFMGKTSILWENLYDTDWAW